MEKLCKRLLKGNWRDNRDRPRRGTAGAYAIGEGEEVIFVAYSKDIRRSLNDHFKGVYVLEDIDKYLQKLVENDALADIHVKWLRDLTRTPYKGGIIKVVKGILGNKPRFNLNPDDSCEADDEIEEEEEEEEKEAADENQSEESPKVKAIWKTDYIQHLRSRKRKGQGSPDKPAVLRKKFSQL